MDIIKEFEKVIHHHTHHITDDHENKWIVLELSDVELILDEYRELAKLKPKAIETGEDCIVCGNCEEECQPVSIGSMCNKCFVEL